MNVHFEELAVVHRAGGIEVATRELAAHLRSVGVKVSRSSEQEPPRLPDCVHLHGIWSPHLASRLLAWRKQGIPCVISPHGMLDPWALSHKWLKKRVAWHVYQRRLLDRAAVLHGASERETGEFGRLRLKPPTALVPWGVSLPAARRNRPDGPGPRIALFVGRIYPVKGLPTLVEAWARVRPIGWQLRIVGPDEANHRREVERVVSTTGVSTAVEFVGELSGTAKDAAYEDAELFVLPSYTENFAMSVAEALAHSLPVITTTGTPWSVLPERGCGWWVAPTVEELAQALYAATALDAQALRSMGEKGRTLVAAEFSWQQTANKLREIYQWALGGQAKPECIVA